MKNKLLLLFFTFSCSATLFAQTNFERCATQQLIQHRENLYPGYAENVQRAFDNAKMNISGARNTVYEIPVVVHVVYNNADQNLADSIIMEQIASLNEDYRRLNADTINMRADFQPHVGDPMIQFRLADFDPQGNPTTGITRTQTSTTSFGSINFLFGDMSDLEAIKSTADGGIDPWDQDRYLNIWVGNMEISGTPALLGYATPPAGLSNWPAGSTNGMDDGVVIQYQAFGRNNPNVIDMGNGAIDIRGRTVSHEVGHYLGLRHIWADGDCTADDGVADTPNADAESNFDCDDTKNTCTDNIGGVDLPDMIENYMDYSAETCQNSFTQGQIDIMRSVLENERDGLLNNGALGIAAKTIEKPNINIYPNPATSSFSIDFGQKFENYKIIVVDLTGKSIYQSTAISSITSIDASNWQSGTYIINIVDNHGSYLSNHKLTVL